MKQLLATLHVFANLLQSVRFGLHYHCNNHQVEDNVKCQIV